MRIRIDVEGELVEDEVIIRCKEVTPQIVLIQKAIAEKIAQKQQFIFYQGEKEYYFPLDEILFFETEEGRINAHTKNDVFQVKYRLYELEELLPACFVRVAKSTIVNSNHIRSITKNLTSASEIEFGGSHKRVFVSRNYYKILKIKLDERRLGL